MESELLTVSRLQFATTVIFHFTWPAITIGLAIWLVILYGLYLWRGDQGALKLYNFWKKIFGLGFGLGVVAGVVMTFEFGLNWSRYAQAVGPILGVIINMEVITAFFLEAGFIGLMLYGDKRVSKKVMMFATCMVALGSIISSSWIMSANSWMQQPSGYKLVNGQFQPDDWWAIIFNPTFLYRFPHLLLGVMISATLLFTGIGAYYLRRGTHLILGRRIFSLGLGALTLMIPVQLWMGDTTAGVMAGFQPAKVQAIEGNWGSENVGYNILIVPDQANQTNKFMLSIPRIGAIISTHSLTKPIPGLLKTPPAEQPPMGYVFYGFRLMYFTAIATFALVISGLLLRLRGEFYTTRWFQTWALWMTPVGVLATIGGWMTAEIGRQPYVVYGQLRTANAVSNLTLPEVWATFLTFLLIYVALTVIYIVYVISVVRRGPEDGTTLAEERAKHEPVPGVPSSTGGD